MLSFIYTHVQNKFFKVEVMWYFTGVQYTDDRMQRVMPHIPTLGCSLNNDIPLTL
jgi:hypothetical protein